MKEKSRKAPKRTLRLPPVVVVLLGLAIVLPIAIAAALAFSSPITRDEFYTFTFTGRPQMFLWQDSGTTYVEVFVDQKPGLLVRFPASNAVVDVSEYIDSRIPIPNMLEAEATKALVQAAAGEAAAMTYPQQQRFQLTIALHTVTASTAWTTTAEVHPATAPSA